MEVTVALSIAGTILAGAAIVVAWPSFRRERQRVSADAFRSVRRSMTAERPAHTALAAQLFDDKERLEGTDYISPPKWRLSSPIDLAGIRVEYRTEQKLPVVSGCSRNARRLLPTSSRPTATYSETVGNDPELCPKLWWNAPSFDLTDFQALAGTVTIGCSVTTYFDMLDISEAVGHEFVAASRSGRMPHSRRLRLRKEIADPFDLARRPFVPAIPTLVLLDRRSGPPTFLLHARDGNAVASAAGMRHLFGGQFQPSTRHSVDHSEEADLWLSVARELAEEMLGVDEFDGSSGGRLSLDDEPLRSLEELRASGKLKIWLVGMGIDPLTLWPDLLAIAVLNAEAFEKRFPSLPTANPEGTMLGASSMGSQILGFEFTEPSLKVLTSDPGTHPAAAACLRLGWRHREFLFRQDKADAPLSS